MKPVPEHCNLPLGILCPLFVLYQITLAPKALVASSGKTIINYGLIGVRMKSIFSELVTDIASPRCISAIALGLVMGVLLVVLEVSFAAMIFSGPMASLATRGAGLTLFGALALCSIIAVTSSFRSTISTPQDAPVAVLATMGVAVAASMGTALPETMFITMVAAIGLTTFITGLAFFMIGQFKLTNFFRFMPYPVVGGFLAGGGWVLTIGGISVMSTISAGFETLPQLFVASILWKWGPGALYAVLLWLILKRWSHFFILPGSILLVTVLYYVAFYALGISVEDARSAGILLSGVPGNGLWPAFSLMEFQNVDWGVVVAQLPIMGTVMLVTMMGLLLNISGLELGGGIDINFNREFRNAGLANMVGSMGGSAPGAPALSLSLLCRMTGAYTRLTGLITACVVGFVLFAGGGALEYFPLPVLGGLLVFLGIDIMDSWLCSTRRKLPILDYGILAVIFLVICFTGFLQGVGVGLVITVVMFIIRFSRVDVIRDRFSGVTRHSRKTRSIPHRAILQSNGERLQGYLLSGYMFFGSASHLGEHLKKGLGASATPWCILIDFAQVSGFDVSAVNVFQRFILAAQGSGVSVVLAEAPERFLDMLSRVLPQKNFGELVVAKDIDRGLESCEDSIIARYGSGLSEQDDMHNALFEQSVDDVMAHLDRQIIFEDLVERLAPWLQERQYAAGEPIVTQGEEQDGLQMIVWGTATAKALENDSRLANHSPGDVLVPQAAFGCYAAREHIEADVSCKTVTMTAAARRLLEQEEPVLALELDRYIISANEKTT